MLFVFIAGGLGALAIACFIMIAMIDKRRERAHRRITDEHKPDRLFTDAALNSIGFRVTDAVIVIGSNRWSGTLPYGTLLAVEVERDNTTIDRVDRGSQIVGAALGGLTFGTAGAIVGGLSGQRVETPHIKALRLKLLLDSFDVPVHEVCFGAWPGNGLPATSAPVQSALRELETFRAPALNAMRRDQ